MLDKNLEILVVRDISGSWMMGFTDGHKQGVQEIEQPLLFVYKQNSTLNSIQMDFSHYDPVAKPKKIHVTISASYTPSKDQVKMYKDKLMEIERGC